MTHDHDQAEGPHRFDPAGFLAERGIDPAELPAAGQPVPFDHGEFRTERALALFATKVPPAFARARVDHPDVQAWVRRYLADPAGCPSLLLVGRTGTGKSHLLWAAIRAIVEATARQGRPVDWRVVTHPDLNAQMRPGADDRHHGALERYMRTGLLGLDDIGAGKQSEWTGDSLFRLVDYRWSHGLPGIYSTNLIGDALVTAVGDRIASRLVASQRVAIVGPDRRQVRP